MKKSFLFTLLTLLVSFVFAQETRSTYPDLMQVLQAANVENRVTHWQPIDPPGSSGMTATLVGYVEIDGVEQRSTQLEVGIFHGDVCRGADYVSVYIPNQDRYFLYCSFFGLNGEEDTFRIYDHATGTELDVTCSQTITYTDNAMIGLSDPYLISFTSNHFEIQTTANPEAGGTVSGAGVYENGGTATLSATANYGYTFVNWTKGVSVASTNTSFSFTVTAATAGEYVANFNPIPYTITATANPTNGGQVEGSGIYNYGTTATLTATPATGYHFVNWTKNGTVVSTSANYSFVVNGSATLVANFAVNSYEITVSANPSAGGTVTGGGNYNHFATCTLMASPNTGYHFVNWTKNGVEVSTSASYSFEVTAGGNYVANFQLNNYTITASAHPTVGGSVSGAGTFNHFETCTLTATANEGYTFVNWMKNGTVVSTNPTYGFTVTEAANFVANFQLNNYTITATANPTAGGTVTGAGTYNHFETCELTATANEGYTFINWTRNGVEVSTNTTYSFTVTEAASFVANFQLNSYTITATANPTAGGTIAGAGTYNHFETCELIATANEGYTFINWTKNGVEVSTNTTYSFTVTEAASLVANFQLNSYEITATANPTAGGSITGAGTYNHFETCELIATANEGYTFINWTKNGVEVSTNTTYSFTVTEAASFVANFQLNSYTITATANPTAGGAVTGAGTYNHFETCELIATANEGYTFINWTKDGMEVSTNTTYSFTVTEAASFVANFQLNSYEITATPNPTAGGSVTGAGTYNHFETCNLTATENEGYTFINWTKNGEVVSTSASYSFTVTGVGNYVANFQLNSYEITATANPEAGGTITGAGTYNHFETCTLTAAENEGYTFINWTKNGVEVSTNLTISFVVTEAATYVANFSLNSYEITATANPSIGGTITGAGTYNHFGTCTLTATESEGYTFVNWAKNDTVVSTSATYSFTVTEAADFVANFSLNSYEITATANPTAGGTITGAGAYNHFETCTLTATENEGYTFINWTKDGEEVADTPVFSFTVTEAASYIAHFSLNSYEITATANPDAGGTVTGADTYNHFDTCTLIATASEGYTFINWTKNDTVVSTSLTYSFMVTEAASLVANFSLNSYEITVAANPTAGGSVAGAGTYNHFETCNLTATENEGYTFINWTKNGEVVSTSASYSFTVNGAGSYVANFQLNSYEITAMANPTAAGTITGAGTYNHFETCTLSVTSNPGYTFLYWSKDGEQVSTNTSISFVVTEPASYVAVFEINGYEITATVNPSESGTVSGTGVYIYESLATLTATANEGYTFVNWTKNDTVVSTNTVYSFTVTDHAAFVANFSLNSYEISATANPTAGGTITGAGTYNHFETCTLTATENEGYTFINWTKDGEEVANTPVFSFTVTEAASYIAHFSLNSYEITATANPDAGGTVAGAGTYNHFETCTLTATENEGYTFANWTRNDTVVSTSATYSFTVTGAADYVANFSLNSYEITVAANPTSGGSVTGAGTYNHFETCNLTATENEGYTFINWTKNGEVVSTSASYSFTVTGAGNYVANFQLNSYEITATANPEAGGTIIGAGTYNHFETCTLTATENEGYTFINWTKNGVEVSTNMTISFVVTEAASYMANFSLNSYEITATANPTAGGSVSGGGTYNHFETCTLTATENEGYTFVNWTKNDTVVSTSATYSFTVTGAAAFVANFSLNSYEITAAANPTAGGTITGAGTYNHFETCTLTATENEGYTFINWTKDGEEVADTPVFSFTVTEAASYIAHFSLNSYEITATANPTIGGTITGAGTYNHFETCILTATEDEGYTFVNWTKNGTVVSTSATYSFTVTEAADFVANFSLNSYEITVAANPTAGGSVTGAGTYNHFETCTLTATENEGYTFINWTKNGEVVSTSASYCFTVNGAGNYVANFQLNSYEITAMANPTAGGTISGAGTYNHFETCTLTATEGEGYTFVNWTRNGEVVATTLSFSITVTEAASFVANFSLNSYEITVNANPSVGGTVTGDGTYNHFQTCTLTAMANEGYTFINWTKNGSVVSTNATYSFTVTEGGAYTANFQLNSYQITATANPSDYGSVSGTGTYNHFETCTLVASALPGYSFVNWTQDGVEVATTESFSFTVTGAASFVANFIPDFYTITVMANPSSGGTVTGGGDHLNGSTCTITATPHTGYTFINWTKDGVVVSTNTSYSFTVTENATYVAHFSHNSYEITATADPTEGGTVTGAGTYYHGSTCTLVATANTGYTFVRWTKDGVTVSTNTSFSFTVTEAASYVAHFTLNMYLITVSADPVEGGTVMGGGAFNYGENCTIMASAYNGYHFVNWTKDGVQVSTNENYTFTVTEAATYVAHFALNQYQITVSADPSNGGTATGGGTYTHGTQVNLTATANTGYHFVNWTKDGHQVSTNPTYSFTATESAEYIAHFEQDVVMHEVTTEANPAEGGTTSGDGQYAHGSYCTVSATANEGYTFVNWTKNGQVISTDADYRFVVNSDTHLVAHFQPNNYQITATVDPEQSGIIHGTGTYSYGQTATLTVTPNESYEFLNWTEDGEVVSEDANYSFVVTENHNLVAHLMFVDGIGENYNVDISVYPNPTSYKVTVEASQVINRWEIITTTGSLIYSSNDNTDKKEFWVNQLAPGTYLIRMTINNVIITRKFVKKM